MTEFTKWTSIELLHNTVKSVEHCHQEGERPTIVYRPKVKLDGTNAGVRIDTDGQVFAQSRSRSITPEDDNLGFARWVADQGDVFRQITGELVIHGEWCGQGIQKRTSVTQIGRKIFAVFAVQRGAELITVPTLISDVIPEHEDMPILPWLGTMVYTADFSSRESLQRVADVLNSVVTEVEKCDPWVKSQFGIEGLGEGIVMYPNVTDRDEFSKFVFKVKGSKHQSVKSKKPAQVDPEIAASIEEFASLMVTEARLEQGMQEACAGVAEMKLTGNFIKWVSQDVLKESTAELEASELEWKQVAKAVSTTARAWYQGKATAL